jgi:hypothetical protein
MSLVRRGLNIGNILFFHVSWPVLTFGYWTGVARNIAAASSRSFHGSRASASVSSLHMRCRSYKTLHHICST